jgi:uncharacterized membrane protein HdeD (DUF308 family)
MASLVSDMSASVDQLRKQWGWFLALGIGLIVLGILAMMYTSRATIASVVGLGFILLVAGAVQTFAAFQARGAGHVILYLLLGALDIIVGVVLIESPAAGALAVTLVLAVYFMFSGVFRFVYSLWAQFPMYGWAALSGIVSVALGVLLLAQWPSSAFWFLGFAVGVNFILVGVSWSIVAFRIKPAAATT